MSNIRDYMKAKEKRQSDAKDINYKEKIRGHKLTVFYRIALTIVLSGALVFAFYIQWRDKIYTDNVVMASAEVHVPAGTKVKNLGGNILHYSKDGASCMDTKGNAIWNQTYEMQNPILAICQDVVAIGDYNGSVIYVMSAGKQLGEIETNLPIRYFDVAANGEVAVALDDGNITWIYLYTATGKEISFVKSSMDKSGYPVGINVSPNGKLVGVSHLYVDRGVMKSSIIFYNFGAVGQNASNYMSGYNYLDTIVPCIKFMDNESAFALSDDRIMFFTGNEKPVSIKDNLLDEEVQSVYYNEDYVGLVFNNTSGETLYRLDVYDKKGSLLISKNFDIEYSEIIFSKDRFIIYNDLDCIICNVSGAEKYDGAFDKTTALLIPTSTGNKYVAVSSDSIDILELK